MAEAPPAPPVGMRSRLARLNPISNFKRVFKKDIEQQWDIARVMFVQTLLHSVLMTFIYLVSQDIQMRMDLEESESRLVLAVFMHIACWFLLCSERRKNFALPRLMGYLLLNIYILTQIFMQVSLVTLRDPSYAYMYNCLILGDYLFGFMYTLLSNYIHPTGYFGFCFFPKIFIAFSLYFYYDDRVAQVFQLTALTSLTTFINALTAEGLLLNCENDQITEFKMPDFYVLLYLDLPYIVYQSYHGAAALLEGISDRLFKAKTHFSEEAASDGKEKKD